MPRPRTVYRGKRKYSWIITLLAMIVVVFITLSIWLFYYLQKFIVYDKDGLHLDLSVHRDMLSVEDQPQPGLPIGFQPIDVEIVVEQPDYSKVVTNAGRDLQAMHAVYLPAAELNETALKFYAADMGDFDALVLELKARDGFLRWHSSVPTADSYAVNGSLELAEHVALLKEKGVYLVAQLSALTDSVMAERNVPIALKNSLTGLPLTDADGSAWLDPYNDSTRAYLLDLITELDAMGFDEILLTDVTCPNSEYLQFSKQMTQTPDAVIAVSSLALWLREQADTLGVRLSAMIRSDVLRGGEDNVGQDPVVFFKAFDRVAVETDFDYFTADIEALQNALGAAGGTRIVAVTDDYIPAQDSYIVR